MSKPKRQTTNAGMPAARASPEELAERYLGLVVPIARSFQNRLPACVDFDDLVGAGNLGLVQAARRFDLARGASFSTFAKHHIRGAITDSLRRNDPVSRHLRSQQKAAERATRELMIDLARPPTEAETARRLRVSMRRWQRLRAVLHEAGCPVNGNPTNGASTPADVDKLPGTEADPERLAGLAEIRNILAKAMLTLPARSRHVLRLYDFEEWTMKQIGTRLGMHESRVSQIRTAALVRLRAKLAPRFGKSE